MRRHAPYLAALVFAGCVAAPAAAQPVPHPGGGPGVRAKTAAVGAELAEQWSPAIGAALSLYRADPSVSHEIQLAHTYYASGILDQAFDHYAAVARRAPREAAAWDGCARVWRDWGYPQLGLGDAYRAVSADPRSPAAQNTLGTILHLLGRPDDAAGRFETAVALDPSASYAHYNLGMARSSLGRCREAGEAFERAVVLDSAFAAALARHAGCRVPAGKGGSHERP